MTNKVHYLLYWLINYSTMYLVLPGEMVVLLPKVTFVEGVAGQQVCTACFLEQNW